MWIYVCSRHVALYMFINIHIKTFTKVWRRQLHSYTRTLSVAVFLGSQQSQAAPTDCYRVTCILHSTKFQMLVPTYTPNRCIMGVTWPAYSLKVPKASSLDLLCLNSRNICTFHRFSQLPPWVPVCRRHLTRQTDNSTLPLLTSAAWGLPRSQTQPPSLHHREQRTASCCPVCHHSIRKMQIVSSIQRGETVATEQPVLCLP